MSKKRNIQSHKKKSNFDFKKFLSKRIGKFVTAMCGTWLASLFIGLFLLYGPYSGFREFAITSAMTTLNHKYLATLVYPQSVIDKVMSKNTVVELGSTTDTDKVTTNKKGENEIKLTEISKDGYNAWALEISDPSSVILGVSRYFGVKGQKMPYLLENYRNAVAGINAGGFGDRNGFGNGGVPIGLVISEGNVLHMPNKPTYDIIGFNEENVLIAGQFKKSEIEGLKLRDAVEFTPFLIINGEAAEIKGNGGWGLAPRTAIGQRTDGTVVFVVVDGRSAKSMGVTMKTLRDIMVDLDCYTAANLDGGSSTVLSYKDEIVNDPSGSDKDGMRFIPNGFIVIDD